VAEDQQPFANLVDLARQALERAGQLKPAKG
jgi:hypothetical protein